MAFPSINIKKLELAFFFHNRILRIPGIPILPTTTNIPTKGRISIFTDNGGNLVLALCRVFFPCSQRLSTFGPESISPLFFLVPDVYLIFKVMRLTSQLLL
jgi:hypothetical protein